jgi:hypothetical protein
MPKDPKTSNRAEIEALMAATDLNSDHRDTLERIFSHPSSSNIEWRQVVSLLEALGAVTEKPNGRFEVELGGEVEVLDRPAGKDIDQQTIVDLRRMLSHADDVFVRTRPL